MKKHCFNHLYVGIGTRFSEIKLLSQKLSYEENMLNVRIMADMIYKIADSGKRLNEKSGKMLGL